MSTERDLEELKAELNLSDLNEATKKIIEIATQEVMNGKKLNPPED